MISHLLCATAPMTPSILLAPDSKAGLFDGNDVKTGFHGSKVRQRCDGSMGHRSAFNSRCDYRGYIQVKQWSSAKKLWGGWGDGSGDGNDVKQYNGAVPPCLFWRPSGAVLFSTSPQHGGNVFVAWWLRHQIWKTFMCNFAGFSACRIPQPEGGWISCGSWNAARIIEAAGFHCFSANLISQALEGLQKHLGMLPLSALVDLSFRNFIWQKQSPLAVRVYSWIHCCGSIGTKLTCLWCWQMIRTPSLTSDRWNIMTSER